MERRGRLTQPFQTVRSFKRKYYGALKEQVRQSGQSAIVESIPSKKRGRPLTLGDLDNEVQQYVQALRTAGTPVGSSVIIAAARGIVMAKEPTLLLENGGHVVLSKSWAHCLMIRMGLVKRKASTKISKMTTEEFEQKKVSFLKQVSAFVAVHTIPSSLVLNWDQTGINVLPSANYTMEQRGSKRIEIAGYQDKRQITATFAATLSGEFLPMQILYTGKTERCHPKHQFPASFDVYHTTNHWSNEEQ